MTTVLLSWTIRSCWFIFKQERKFQNVKGLFGDVCKQPHRGFRVLIPEVFQVQKHFGERDSRNGDSLERSNQRLFREEAIHPFPPPLDR